MYHFYQGNKQRKTQQEPEEMANKALS